MPEGLKGGSPHCEITLSHRPLLGRRVGSLANRAVLVYNQAQSPCYLHAAKATAIAPKAGWCFRRITLAAFSFTAVYVVARILRRAIERFTAAGPNPPLG